MLEKLSACILPVIILIIITTGMLKKVPVYEEFIEGAKDGFKISVTIIPYLVAFIVAVSMLRASGAMEVFSASLSFLTGALNIPPDIFPIMVTRSLSGSATLGLFSELVSANGANSYAALMAAVMVGSSETTFYVLSVYFGSVGIKKFKYAVLVGILADITGILLAILAAQFFFLPSSM